MMVRMFANFLSIFSLFLVSSEAPPQAVVRTMTIERQLIVRVPIRPRPMAAFHWEEAKGPKCFPVSALAGAFLSAPDSVDLVLRNRQRLRAKLDNDCEGLDFYGGLYMQVDDGQICAKRDVIRSRVGGTCRIDKLRALVAKPDR